MLFDEGRGEGRDRTLSYTHIYVLAGGGWEQKMAIIEARRMALVLYLSILVCFYGFFGILAYVGVLCHDDASSKLIARKTTGALVWLAKKTTT